MSDKVQKALKNHKKGYNCAQSVACAFCKDVGIDEKTMFQLMEGYGLGMGCMQATCGAISGAVAVLGAKSSTGNLEKPNSKASTYKLCKELVSRFQEKNGATICKEIKGVKTGKILRDCSGCVQDAAEILEELLERK